MTSVLEETEEEGLPWGPVDKSPPANEEIQVQSLVWEYSICLRATKPMCLEPVYCSKRSLLNQRVAPTQCN